MPRAAMVVFDREIEYFETSLGGPVCKIEIYGLKKRCPQKRLQLKVYSLSISTYACQSTLHAGVASRAGSGCHLCSKR